MKAPLFCLFLVTGGFCLAAPHFARAQDADDLSVTLPNGKVLHFQTEEQKERFEAAREAQATKLQQAAAQAIEQTPAPRKELGHTALDEVPATGGKVNLAAPTFTADYYMAAPESWVGRPITLSVALVRPIDEKPRADGLRELEALTYNNDVKGFGSQNAGGYIMIMAKPDVAFDLIQRCGTRYQYNWNRLKTTLIKGELRKFSKIDSSSMGSKTYGFFVEQ